MRLLNVQTLKLESFLGQVPPYAILSHTWGNEELQFDELNSASAQGKVGYQKIRSACTKANEDGHSYVWIDTCCIDSSSSAELSEAINSMFNWYRKSKVCYVYLEDVDNVEGLKSARWFTRGWTLQELLAPAQIIFYSKNWQILGNKTELALAISQITGINPNAFRGLSTLDYIRNTSVAKRMSWASARETTKEEDIAYCLLGLFDVNMPLLYGEGEKAFLRLQEEIMKSSSDQSLLAWGLPSGDCSENSPRGILANHPRDFANSSNIVPTGEAEETSPFSMSNKGLRIRLPVFQGPNRKTHVAVLACTKEGKFTHHIGLSLTSTERKEEVFYRSLSSLASINPRQFRSARMRDVYILRGPICTEVKPPLLLVREMPSADSGLTLAGFTASHGDWDEENRTIELSQTSHHRLYELEFRKMDDSSIRVLVSQVPGSRYSADVYISHPSQAVSPKTSATNNPQRTCKYQLGARHTVSTLIAWHFMLGREVLVLEVKVLKRWQWHSILTLSGLRFILESIWTLSTSPMNPFLFEKIEYTPFSLVMYSLFLVVFLWLSLDANNWSATPPPFISGAWFIMA